MIIIRATNDNGQVVDLDVLDPSQPLKLDISAIENTQIGSAFGISSQTFSLPGTDKNNQFFGNLFNLGATAAVALQNSVPVQLLTDGQAVFTGKMYVTDIVTDQKGYTTYQVNLVNETVDFKFQLTETLLSELDWTQYNHNYTYANITSSWSNNLFSGSIVYPHVNYGIPDGSTDYPDYAFGTSTTSKTFDNINYPLRVDQFKPAIKVKSVLDKIFNSVDYKYTSSFIDSAYFNKLYMLTTNYDGLGTYNENPSTGSVWAYRTGSGQTFNATTDTVINFNAEYFDNFNRFNLSTDTYTTYADGLYNFAIGLDFTLSGSTSTSKPVLAVRLQETGSLSTLIVKNYTNVPNQGTLYVPMPNVNLTAGTNLQVVVELITSFGGESITIQPTAGTYFKVEGPSSKLGTNVNMGQQFPNNMKALDFIQGLIEKFNLVIEPVSGAKNVLRIEPFQTWIDQGTTKDWTDKIDRSTRFKIVHPISEQPKTISFRDEDDEASINKYTKDNFGDTFGTYIYENESDLPIGERNIGKIFAATPVKGIQNGDGMIIPHLGKLGNNKQTLTPFQFKPRLLVGNGLKTIPTQASGVSGSTFNPGKYYFQDENLTKHQLSQYYQMTTFDDLATNFATGSDLHFGNLNWYQYFQYTGINGRTTNDAYTSYWATYINSLYDIDARKLTCNVYIEPSEVQDIQLNDKIFIDGAYYRINKMSGVNITEKATVEVEFIKQLNRQLTYPRRRVVTTTGEFTDIVVKDIFEKGDVEYEYFDGGAVVYDYGEIKQAAFKDGFTVFDTASTGSVTWNIPSVVTQTQEKAVFGSNQVDESVGTIFMAGGNNTVEGQAQNILTVGDSNTIKAGTSTVTITGKENTVDLYADNVNLLGTVGSTVSGSINNVVMLGGSGSLMDNTDYSMVINGEAATVRDSDYTTAINPHTNEVIINGSGHTVIGLNLEGAGLDLLNTRANSNWLGDTYAGGAQFIDSYTLSVGDSTNIYLTGSNPGQGRHESLYIVNWSGLSPGTASINLPSATNNDYEDVVYTFKGSNLNAGDQLRIVPFTGTQTIDGATSYTLSGDSGSAPWVTLHASGGDWYVINAVGSGGGGGPSTPAFPYTGSAQITGSLGVTGSVNVIGAVSASAGFTGSLFGTATSASYAPNIYNQDGQLNGNRTVNLNGNNLEFVSNGGETFTISSDPSSTVEITNLTQASQSLVIGYNLSTGQLTAMNTSSFAGGAAFPYSGSAQITGSLGVTGSITSPVVALTASAGTASMDLSKGNAFVITLTTASATYITATNIVPNQHVSLLVQQSASGVPPGGNLFFTGSVFYFASGSEYVTSLTTGSKDILTFETFTFNPPVLANASITKNLVAASQAPVVTTYMSASGGTEFTSGSFRIHKFTGSATLTVHSLGTFDPGAYEQLLVAGGGGGSGGISGTAFGSGGAGGTVRSGEQAFATTGSFSVVVGAGGAGGGIDVAGSPGGNSTLNSQVAISGSGAGTGVGGSNADYSGASRSGLYGGGGAGAGANGVVGGNSGTGSYGGDGAQSNISGSLYIYYGGGGGGGRGSGTPGAGTGGQGGGGAGSGNQGQDGTDALGGGGGGSGNFSTGGSGGDGVVMIKYQYQA